MKKIMSLFVALLLALTMLGVSAGTASAHTPNVSAHCNGVVVEATSYSSDAHITVKVGGTVVEDAAFSGSFGPKTYAVPQDGKTTTYDVFIDERKDGNQYDKTVTGSVGPCGTPPVTPPVTPPTPPVCDNECEVPFVKNNAPKVTTCNGVISDRVLNNVRVLKRGTCTLVDVHVNGSVRAVDARNLIMADTTVRKDVIARRVSGDVIMGSKGNACRYDPYVGGNVEVTDSHNVLICQTSVCKDIVVSNNDGRITVKDSKARVLRVVRNNRFVSDTNRFIPGSKVIRILSHEGKRVVKDNAPRRVVVR